MKTLRVDDIAPMANRWTADEGRVGWKRAGVVRQTREFRARRVLRRCLKGHRAIARLAD